MICNENLFVHELGFNTFFGLKNIDKLKILKAVDKWLACMQVIFKPDNLSFNLILIL